LAIVAVLALLSMTEFAFPKLKWLLFPAELAVIILAAAIRLYDRMQQWRAMVQRAVRWMLRSDKHAESDVE
jgi:hypothetical protein